MKKISILIVFIVAGFVSKAQTIESFQFNLYTDSLKKGTHNYINIDAKMSDGSWRPLTEKELFFTADYGTFEKNSLVLPQNPTVKQVTIKVTLKSNPQKTKQITIGIKQKPDPPLAAYDADANPKRRGAKRLI